MRTEGLSLTVQIVVRVGVSVAVDVAVNEGLPSELLAVKLRVKDRDIVSVSEWERGLWVPEKVVVC